MKERFIMTFVAGCLLLAGCVLPPVLAPILRFISPISGDSVPDTVTPIPGPVTLTPFQPIGITATFTPFQPIRNIASFTPSVSVTLTLTPTLTDTLNPEISLTPTLAGSPTKASTITRSPSMSRNITSTPTATSSSIATLTPTQIYPLTSTPSNTEIASVSFTLLPSLTPSITSAASATFTPTSTFTQSTTYTPPLTSTPSITSTVTGTSSPTSTFTATSTWTLVPTSPSGCSPVYNSAFEAQVIALINNERAIAGLPPLVENGSLDSSARAHSLDMSVNNFLSHTGSDGSSYWTREVRAGYTGRWGGEIIYAGSGAYNSPDSAVRWWMNDPPHKALILADYYDVGAGYVYCSTSSYGGFFTADFGHR